MLLTVWVNTLVKNLSDNGFKYLSQEFSGDMLKFGKQNGVYPSKYMDSFKKMKLSVKKII